MSLTVFFIELLLVHYTTQSQGRIQANCREDVSLSCSGDDIHDKDFFAVTWYKLTKEDKHGIIRRSKGDNKTQYYEFPRPTSFGEKYSLLLRNVTPEDSGTYDCSINANIGGQNTNFEVELTVHDCVTPAVFLMTVTPVLNMTESTPSCQRQVEDLPVAWSVIGYMALGLVKIVLCLITIWVVRFRSSKRRQYRW